MAKGCKIVTPADDRHAELMKKYGQLKGTEKYLSEKNNTNVTQTTDNLVANQADAIEDIINEHNKTQVIDVIDNEETGSSHHEYVYNGVNTNIAIGLESGSREAVRHTRKGNKYAQDKGENKTEASILGTKAHRAFAHIIASAMIKVNPKYADFYNQHIISDSELKSDPMLEDLVKLGTPQLKEFINSEISKGNILLPEVQRVNLKTKIGATIDILSINKKGEIAIYDFKTSKGSGKFNSMSLAQYNRQLSNYADVFTNPDNIISSNKYVVNERRLIKVQLANKKDVTTKEVDENRIGKVSIPMTNKKIDVIPVMSESTHVVELDKMLGALYNQINIGEETIKKLTGESNFLRRQSIRAQIDKNKELIKQIQLKKDVSLITDSVIKEINFMVKNVEDSNWDSIDIYRYQSTLKLYSHIKDFVPNFNKLTDKEQAAFYMIEGKASTLFNHLKNDVVKGEILQTVSDLGMIGRNGKPITKEELFGNYRDISKFKAWFLGLWTTNNPLVYAIKMLVDNANMNTRVKSSILYNTLVDLKKGVIEVTGKSGVDAWDVFAQKKKDGTKSGRTISNIQHEFWVEMYKNKKESNIQWFLKNTTFDKERYNVELERHKEFLESQRENYKFDAIRYYEENNVAYTNTQLTNKVNLSISTALALWKTQNAIIDAGHEIGSMRFFKPIEYDKNNKSLWHDDGFDIINNTPALKAFYDKYTETMKELKIIVPQLKPDFIANIPAEYAELSTRLGIKTASKMKIDEVVGNLTSEYNEKEDLLYDDELLDPVRNIPLIGINENYSQGVESKSYDLANSLYLLANSVYKYGELSNIEERIKNIMVVLKDKDNSPADTDIKGGFIKDVYGNIKKTMNPGSTNNTMIAVENYVRSELYGKTHGEKDDVIKHFGGIKSLGIKERDINFTKWGDNFLKYTALKNLSFNLFAPPVNFGQAYATALITGVGPDGARLYSQKNFEIASMLVTSGKYNFISNDGIKMHMIMDYFGVTHHEFTDAWAKDLSSIKMKGINLDLGFKPMEWGDTLVQNSVLGAMLMEGKYGISWDDFTVVKETINGKTKNKLVYKEGKEELPNFLAARFKSKVVSVNNMVVGDYNSSIAIKQWFLGRALMQHRNWIPAMFQSRFSRGINKETGEGYNYTMEKWMEGRYITLFKKVGWQALGIMMKNGIMLHKSTIADFEHLDIEASQIANMKSNLVELEILAGLLILTMALKGAGEGDEDRSWAYRYSLRTLTRLYSELGFFADPRQIGQILISPTASVSAAQDIGKIIQHTFNKGEGWILGDEGEQKKAKPMHYVAKATPFYHQFDKFIDFLSNNKVK